MWTEKSHLAAAWGAFASVAGAAQEHAAGQDPSLFAGDLGNAIFTLLIFVLVLAVLGKFAWRPLLNGLQKRERFIRESLEAARKDRQECELRLREYEQRLTRAREEATAIVEEGRRDGEVVKRRIEEEARKTADSLIERARREITIARDSALKDLFEQSAQLAMTMAGSVLKRQLGPEDQNKLVADAIEELRTRGLGNSHGESEASAS